MAPTLEFQLRWPGRDFPTTPVGAPKKPPKRCPNGGFGGLLDLFKDSTLSFGNEQTPQVSRKRAPHSLSLAHHPSHPALFCPHQRIQGLWIIINNQSPTHPLGGNCQNCRNFWWLGVCLHLSLVSNMAGSISRSLFPALPNQPYRSPLEPSELGHVIVDPPWSTRFVRFESEEKDGKLMSQELRAY